MTNFISARHFAIALYFIDLPLIMPMNTAALTIESLQPPGHPVTAAVLKDRIKRIP